MVKKGKKRLIITLPEKVVDLLHLRAKNEHISVSKQVLDILEFYEYWFVSYSEIHELGYDPKTFKLFD